jgi:hypothetical protein
MNFGGGDMFIISFYRILISILSNFFTEFYVYMSKILLFCLC